MRKAYLIIAHDQPALLARLVGGLSCKDAHFFIHIDRSTDIRPFEERLLSHLPNTSIHWIRKRLRVRWMGFSMVEAALELMQQASTFAQFSYYSLLSGTDYPIKPNAHILEFLEGKDTEYFCYWKLDDRPSWKHKIEYYYPIDWVPIRNYKSTVIRRLFWVYYLRSRRRLPKRRFLRNIVPYGGPEWWTLSHSCVRFILNYVNNHPDVCDFYRYTHSPDEMFFQTIIMNSEYSERAHRIDFYQKWSHYTCKEDKETGRNWLSERTFNLRYVDWDVKREKPAILDERDFNALKSSECLFARKFDTRKSARLLDLIDSTILNVNAWAPG